MDVFFNVLIVAIVMSIGYFPIKIILVKTMPIDKTTDQKVRSAKISTLILFLAFSFLIVLEHFGYF